MFVLITLPINISWIAKIFESQWLKFHSSIIIQVFRITNTEDKEPFLVRQIEWSDMDETKF